MIEPACLHSSEIQSKYVKTWMDPKFKWYHEDSYVTIDIAADTSSFIQFASINNDEVIGLIEFGINRARDIIHYVSAINFSEDYKHFGIDVMSAFKWIFKNTGFKKIEFAVVVGNPAEIHYDRLVDRLGGRVVGTFTESIKLMDGSYHDIKWYEIMREGNLNIDKYK